MQAANDNVDPNAPLRLAVAAEHAFPFGGMTEKGLRCEAKRGRLVIWRIANKDFTSLAAIEEMRRKCRLQDNQPASGSVQQEERSEEHTSELQSRQYLVCRLLLANKQDFPIRT